MMELNYFDCRGRVQAIRNYLYENDIPFIDRRISLDDGFKEWVSVAKDEKIAGRFGLVPTMRLKDDGPVISETLVIAFELAPNLTLGERMLLSSAYSEVIHTIAILIWSEFIYPGVDVKAAAEVAFVRLKRLFYRWEKLPEFEASSGQHLSLMQHFLGEAVSASRYLYQGRVDATLAKCPRLAAFDKTYQAAIAKIQQPSRFTPCPVENDLIQRINATT